MCEHRIKKGQQRIDGIQWRPPIAAVHYKIVLLRGNEMIENSEIEAGALALYSAETIERCRHRGVACARDESAGHVLEFLTARRPRLVADRASKHRPRIDDLRRNNVTC